MLSSQHTQSFGGGIPQSTPIFKISPFLSRTRIKNVCSLGVLLRARFVGGGKRKPGTEEAGDVGPKRWLQRGGEKVQQAQ
jgi:hypothetical protein